MSGDSFLAECWAAGGPWALPRFGCNRLSFDRSHGGFAFAPAEWDDARLKSA